MRYIKEKAPSVKSKVKQINKKIGKLVSKKEDAINKAKELADSEEPSGKMQASLAKIQLRQSESEAEKLMLQKQAEILKGKIDTAKKKEKTTKDIDIEEMENRPITILEGVMSDIHQMISNHKNFDSFQKEFFKEYGHKKVMKKTPEFLEWLEALYTDSQFAVAEADAYKELPGDKEAKDKGEVKTSKHVKKYHELYGDKKDESLVNEDFPGKGETVKAKDLNHEMLDYFNRMNISLSINTKSKKNIKGSVGTMFNDLVFNGGDIDKKDIVSVKIIESVVNEEVVYNSSNTKPEAAKKATKEFGKLLPKANKGVEPYVFAVVKTKARNYRLAIKSGSYVAHEFMTGLRKDGILTADIVKKAVANVIKMNPEEFNESVVKESLESESPNNITCGNCAWTWLRQDGGDDMYTCHKCGTDNAPSLGESTQNEGYQNFDGEMARDLKGDSGVKFKKGDKVTLEIQPNNYVIYGPNKTKIIVNKRDFRGAIDQYVIYESSTLNEEDSYNDYPAAAKKNAKKALDWRDEHGRDEVDAGTAVGWTRANQLAKGEKISADTVKRMASFNRHRKNSSIKPELKATPWKDKGYVSWLIWGGDEGVDWAMKKSKEIDNMKESKQMRYIKPLKESAEVNESSDQKKFKQFWDKGPETAIRKTFGKDYDKAIDNRIALLLTIVKDPDDAEKYSEMDFLSLPSGISSQLVNMDPKAIDSILDESVVTEGMSKSAIKKAIKVIDQQIEDEEGGDGEPLTSETLQDLERERERLLGMNESKFSPKGYAKRVVDGTIRIKDAMKEAGISLGNMAKLIAKIDKSFDVNAAFLEKNVMQNDPEKYVESRKNLKFVKHLHESFINDKDISDWEKEHGNLPIPKKIIDISKNMAKEGFIRKATKSVQAKLWIALEGKSWMEMKDQFGDIVGTFYGSTFYTQMTDTMSERAAYYAYSVSMGISDKVANDEEIEPAYYEMKSYFNAFGMDYGRNRIFDRAVSELESWMKKQKITTL